MILFILIDKNKHDMNDQYIIIRHSADALLFFPLLSDFYFLHDVVIMHHLKNELL